MGPSTVPPVGAMLTLPGDAVRQILWRFAGRFDLQMLVQSARAVARGTVARMVAAGERNTHEWTPAKNEMMEAFDCAGITSAFLEPEHGGFISGPKNLALGLAAFELAWVDGGAATASLASFLALAPILERGTPEQSAHYMTLAAPPQAGEQRKTLRGAFALTEPIPYVGVDTGILSGRMRIAEWKAGEEPILQVEKRGRFITNIACADFVSAAVDSGDERITGSCIIILEATDEGTFDRGTPTKKLVHQLSSTGDPIFNLKVPARRIVGGYSIKDGKIVPNYSHGEVIEAVFRRTRVTVGLMTSAKLLSAIEPVIRYQRGRFRGAESIKEGSPRYDLGLQQREDATQRLVDIWASGEASAALGFAAARLFDELEPLERQIASHMAEPGLHASPAEAKALREALRNSKARALELLNGAPTEERRAELEADPQVSFALLRAAANVLSPATKLWNTGEGTRMMREAVCLMGGYGITEDCPGFLGNKWMDAQLEATYEGPEAVQRRQLTLTMTTELFLAQFRMWIKEMREIAAERPATGACTLATAMTMWLWTLHYTQHGKDADGSKLYQGQRQAVTFALADALCWLLAVRCQILDVREFEARGGDDAVVAEGLPATLQFFSDLCHVQSARAAGEVSRICTELVYGYNQHPTSNTGFMQLQNELATCLTGSRLAKDRAADTVTKVMIPEALDYPA